MTRFFEELNLQLDVLGKDINNVEQETEVLGKSASIPYGDVLMRATLCSLFGHHSLTIDNYQTLF
jgi:hypothetical protein